MAPEVDGGRTVLSRTTAVCDACGGAAHPAEFVREGNRVRGYVRCPRRTREYHISADADLFLRFREMSGQDPAEEPSGRLRFVLNYISITNACNLCCRVCVASSEGQAKDKVFLSVDEICRRGAQVRKADGKVIHLFGGEPTVHPDLPEIIGRLSRMGLRVGIVTNGYLLGTKPELARELKKRGLASIVLQFDSLKEKTLAKLGRPYLWEKLNALRNALAAGLYVGLNCLVTKENIPEMAELLTYGLERGHRIWNITFASAVPFGRYTLDGGDSPDREQIVRELLKAGGRYGLSVDDFRPWLSYRPWGVQCHPDCGVDTVFLRTPRGIHPLNFYLNVGKLYEHMRGVKVSRSFWSAYLLPLAHVMRSVRRRQAPACLIGAIGLLFFRNRYSILRVVIPGYWTAMLLDEQRLKRCVIAFHTSVGPVRGCQHLFSGSAFPGSHEYELLHGSC